MFPDYPSISYDYGLPQQSPRQLATAQVNFEGWTTIWLDIAKAYGAIHNTLVFLLYVDMKSPHSG